MASVDLHALRPGPMGAWTMDTNGMPARAMNAAYGRMAWADNMMMLLTTHHGPDDGHAGFSASQVAKRVSPPDKYGTRIMMIPQ